EAVALARQHDLKVGMHLCLTCDWDRMKWGPITRAPSLCDSYGHFFPSFAALGQTALDEEMFEELDAQVSRVKELGLNPTHVDSHMLGSTHNTPFTLRIKAQIAKVMAKHDLIYTYDWNPERRLFHFRDEYEITGNSEREIWARLESWTTDGTYHLFGHAAEPAPELEALCSREHPSSFWTAAYRVRDLAFFTSPRTLERLESLAFELIDVPQLIKLRA
ncbi:MAG TPA: ChbG/HpnK family deacetylase, partial [Polyangiaceae bacterium]|nr:ChbG/HpnK family deacetylase [Polyangiaceae bacterium]